MCKVPVQQDHEAMPSFDLCSRFKRFKLLEPSMGVLGFFLVAVCMICCFFYLDYRAVAKGYMVPTMGERFMWLNLDESSSSSISEIKRVDFLSIEGGGCDEFDGDWVWDERYPLYESKDCCFLDEGFRCTENGRPDLLYTKWSGSLSIVTSPDLMGRCWRSCGTSGWYSSVIRSEGTNGITPLHAASAVDNKDSIYEVNGNPITKHKGAGLLRVSAKLQDNPQIGSMDGILSGGKMQISWYELCFYLSRAVMAVVATNIEGEAVDVLSRREENQNRDDRRTCIQVLETVMRGYVMSDIVCNTQMVALQGLENGGSCYLETLPIGNDVGANRNWELLEIGCVISSIVFD
ncbi:E1 C-terminal related 1 isoform 1 [Hibiscus syriacus]|uniref:E1 C-terminal related 1 isoform 1 n=1 Tax=Hibiscus syriacus TaxID=106335 RepID=A0A6A3D3W7_HIBSY|nr:E1 C-terminal related 1 isoform 1 [Hibiscus syriacus]